MSIKEVLQFFFFFCERYDEGNFIISDIIYSWRLFPVLTKLYKCTKKLYIFLKLTPDHLLLDSVPNLGPLISRWEINKFENCWYKSVRILEVLKLLFQQFLNLWSFQRDIFFLSKHEGCNSRHITSSLLGQNELTSSHIKHMSGPILGALSNNRWSWGILHVLSYFCHTSLRRIPQIRYYLLFSDSTVYCFIHSLVSLPRTTSTGLWRTTTATTTTANRKAVMETSKHLFSRFSVCWMHLATNRSGW